MAACVALCTLSCGSDDDDDAAGRADAHYTPQKYEAEATAFQLTGENAPSVTVGDETVSLTEMHFTESGKAIFETTHQRGLKKTVKYTTYDVEISGDTYTVKDGSNVIGTIKKVSTRSTVEAQITISNLKLKIDNQTYNYNLASPIAAIQLMATLKDNNLIRTWNVKRMKLTLSNPDASTITPNKDYSAGDLGAFLALAKNQGLKLSDNDYKTLARVIESVTIDKCGLFTFTYTDGYNDAAKWEWLPTSNTFTIELKDLEMGHKFLKAETKVEVEYIDNDEILLTMNVKLEEDNCDATVMVTLN
jgi:hypothetical protein